MSNFGATFRKAREAAGLPLDRIAADTRISTRFLLAIESEDFHLLPGGIFNRGFIRSYAERLGMDPDQAVSDYSRISDTVEEPLDVLRNVERASARKSERSLYPVAAAILLALIGLFYIVNRGSRTNPIVPASPRAESREPAPVPAPAEEESPAPSEVALHTDVAPVESQEATPATTPAPLPELLAVASQGEPANAAPPPATSPLALDVDVKDATWILISADGTVVLNEILQAGSTRRFSADRSIFVKIGNAAGATMRINGRDMGPLGVSGQVREFTITPNNALRIQG